jgi:hypothetical protein
VNMVKILYTHVWKWKNDTYSIPGMGVEGGVGEWWKEWFQLWMYSQ